MRRALLLVGLVLLAACGSGSELEAGDERSTTTTAEPGTTTATTTASTTTATATPVETDADPGAELRGKTFVALEASEGGEPHAFLPGSRVSVEFAPLDEGPIIRWSGGCNTTGGSVAIVAERIDVEAQDATAIGCPPEAQAQDDWVSALLTADPAWALDGDRLTLTTADQVLVLVHEVAPY
jgi:heat shock protein HslJ